MFQKHQQLEALWRSDARRHSFHPALRIYAILRKWGHRSWANLVDSVFLRKLSWCLVCGWFDYSTPKSHNHLCHLVSLCSEGLMEGINPFEGQANLWHQERPVRSLNGCPNRIAASRLSKIRPFRSLEDPLHILTPVSWRFLYQRG